MSPVRQRIIDSLAKRYDKADATALSRILCCELLGFSDTEYFLDGIAGLTPAQETLLTDALARLATGEPIQYILGYTWFCGLKFKTDRRALIPRQETTELVEWIEADAKGSCCSSDNSLPGSFAGRLLDLGTGSGCIAISIASKLRGCQADAWDISPEALALARENAAMNGVRIGFEQRDMLAPEWNGGPLYDVIVSNPPYVLEKERSEMEPTVLDFEPHIALFVPDTDALRFYRAAAELGLQALNPGGHLYFETNPLTVDSLAHELESMGYNEITIHKDISARDRMLRATRN